MLNNYTFYIDEFATELKQHINLSEQTWLIIEEDMKNFNVASKKESFSGFLNTVFHNFYQKSNASISLRLLEKKSYLESLYNETTFKNIDNKTVNVFITRYLEVYEKELENEIASYQTGHGEKFRINKDNLDILRDSLEAKYYEGTIGLYLKAIFEEYASKTTYQREQIYFAPIIDKIQKAIYKEKKLKVVLYERLHAKSNTCYRKKFLFTPYAIKQDKASLFNYLIGYSEEIIDKVIKDENGKQHKTSSVLHKTPACIRINNIEKIDVQISMGAHISKADKDELDSLIIKRTPTFMISKTYDVTVQFTEKGLEMFKHQIYMRPQFYEVDKDDPSIYHFDISELHAIFYFFKFGFDAIILSPASLVTKMKSRYLYAYERYNGLSKEEVLEKYKKPNK